MAVIADFEHYPDWVDSMQSAEVLSFVDGKAKTVRMVLDHTLVKDNYVLAYKWRPHVVSWELIEGNLLRAMDGSYQLKANGVDVSDVDVQAWGHFVYFADPDGNKWAVQYIPGRDAPEAGGQ